MESYNSDPITFYENLNKKLSNWTNQEIISFLTHIKFSGIKNDFQQITGLQFQNLNESNSHFITNNILKKQLIGIIQKLVKHEDEKDNDPQSLKLLESFNISSIKSQSNFNNTFIDQNKYPQPFAGPTQTQRQQQQGITDIYMPKDEIQPQRFQQQPRQILTQNVPPQNFQNQQIYANLQQNDNQDNILIQSYSIGHQQINNGAPTISNNRVLPNDNILNIDQGLNLLQSYAFQEQLQQLNHNHQNNPFQNQTTNAINQIPKHQNYTFNNVPPFNQTNQQPIMRIDDNNKNNEFITVKKQINQNHLINSYQQSHQSDTSQILPNQRQFNGQNTIDFANQFLQMEQSNTEELQQDGLSIKNGPFQLGGQQNQVHLNEGQNQLEQDQYNIFNKQNKIQTNQNNFSNDQGPFKFKIQQNQIPQSNQFQFDQQDLFSEQNRFQLGQTINQGPFQTQSLQRQSPQRKQPPQQNQVAYQDTNLQQSYQNLIVNQDPFRNAQVQNDQTLNVQIQNPFIQQNIQEQEQSQNFLICLNYKEIKPRLLNLHKTYLIGRKSETNDIVVMNNSISRQHVAIRYNQITDKYEVMDKGSSSGTYIRVRDYQTELNQGDLFECGFLLFEVTKVKNQNNYIIAEIKVIESFKNDLDGQIFLLKNNDSIGRDGIKCTIAHPEDVYMDQQHSQIIQIGLQLYIKDKSVNGTWKRLSKESEESSWYPLENDQDIFRIGGEFEFKITKQQQNIKPGICHRCSKKVDIQTKPCGHIYTCSSCFSSAAQQREQFCICGKIIQSTRNIYS